MTAADWPGSADPLAMFRHLRGSGPARLVRWAVGLPAPLPERKLAELLQVVCADPMPDNPVRAFVSASIDRWGVAPATLEVLYSTFIKSTPPPVAGALYEQLIVAALADDRHNPPLAAAVRCLFGDPFHPVADPARWRTATAIHIATAVAADGDFSRLPVLADALEDAGCNHPQLLAHLRSGGPHQPGCHALDAVLAR
jgi:hypothetical protein